MTRPTRKVVGTCEACKAELHAAGHADWEGADYVELPLAPGVLALVCAKSLGHDREPSRFPKGPCARRVRQRRNLCPGCGTLRQTGAAADTVWSGVLCEGCEATLSRERDAERAPLKLRQIHSSALFPYLRDRLDREAARLLALAAAGRGRRWVDHPGDVDRYGEKPWASESVPLRVASSALAADPVVEMTDEQAGAIDALAKILVAAFEEQRRRGFAEGDDLLRRLSRGEVRPGDYEQWSAAVRTEK